MLREEIAQEIKRQLLDDQLRRAREDREIREREEERRRKEEEERQGGNIDDKKHQAQRQLDDFFTSEKKDEAQEPDQDMIMQGKTSETLGKKYKEKNGMKPKTEEQDQIEQAEINKFEQEAERTYLKDAKVQEVAETPTQQ